MKISMKKLKENSFIIKSALNIPYGYLVNSKVNKVKCQVCGIIDKDLNAKLSVFGKLYMDNIYPFELDIQENFQKYLRNGQKSLDISLIIWENIVLEVPIAISCSNENIYEENCSYKALEGKD